MPNLPAITKKIVKNYNPEKIILFGSRARGDAHQDSDVDLFIIKKTRDPRIERIIKVDKLFSPRYFSLDLIIRTPQEVKKAESKNNFFIKEILNSGKILYSKAKNA